MENEKKTKFTKEADPEITGREAEIFLNDRKDGFDLRLKDSLKDSIDNLLYDLELARVDLEFAWKIISLLLREVGGSYSVDYEILNNVNPPVVNFSKGAITYKESIKR